MNVALIARRLSLPEPALSLLHVSHVALGIIGFQYLEHTIQLLDFRIMHALGLPQPAYRNMSE